MTLVAVPDAALARRVRAECSPVDVVVWDWRVDPLPPRAAEIRFLAGDYSPSAPDASLLAALAGLAVVQLTSSGFDGWDGSLPPGVVLCTGRGVHGPSTAEAAIAGVLAVLRRIPESSARQAQELWQPLETEQMSGRRVSIIGAGDVAGRIAVITRAMGCATTVVGRTAREGVLGIDSLAETLGSTDILVVAVPLTEHTHGLVDAASLALLPDGAVVANVARGAVVVTEALTAEVSSGRLRAYLDVTDPEPLPPGHPLWHLPGVVLSPHTGGGSVHWRARFGDLACDQVSRFLAGEPLRNVVVAASTDADHPHRRFPATSTPEGNYP